VLAGTTGGVLAGAVLGLLGAVIPGGERAAIGVVLALALVIVPLVRPKWLPQSDRETEQSLLGRGPYQWALFNGLLLGLGFTTRIGYWTWYVIPVAGLISGSPLVGALIWGSYSLCRMAFITALALRMHREPSGMGDLSRRVLALRPAARRASRPVTAVLALALTLWIGW
jgi:hypothetical protein